MICETDTVGNPLCILLTVSPIRVRMTIVSSDTREFRTRMVPHSHWTNGTVSGKLKRFVSTRAYYLIRRTKQAASRTILTQRVAKRCSISSTFFTALAHSTLTSH